MVVIFYWLALLLCSPISYGFLPFRSYRSYFTKLYAKKSNKSAPVIEFSRSLSAAQVTMKRPVLCKIVAKEGERAGLATRFDVFEISYFAANVTITRTDAVSLLIEGELEAHIKDGAELPPVVITTDFDTLVLDKGGGGSIEVSFEENMDYDDEVSGDGSIDIGEVAAQYLGMEIY